MNLQRLLDDIEALSGITEPGTPGFTRRFPSPAYLQGRAWVRERFLEAGLTVRIDTAGNLFGTRAGKGEAIQLGSHTDTVFAGGRLDGPLGTLAALEVARSVETRRPLVVVDYLAEEANDFGVSCVGSRCLAGTFQSDWLARELSGETLGQAIAAVGGDPSRLAEAALPAGSRRACLELHIEQGPVLENAGASLGVVTGIVGITRGSVVVTGQPDHAGTAPMSLRRDALAGAAEMVLAAERVAREHPLAVATVGRLEVDPNQANVVPGKVSFTAEFRHLEEREMAAMWDAFWAEAQRVASARGLGVELAALTRAQPSLPPHWLRDLVLGVCRELDPRARELPSGAGHDTGHVGKVAPAVMLFVPSVGGRSHCPEEHTRDEDVAQGLLALGAAVRALDAE